VLLITLFVLYNETGDLIVNSDYSKKGHTKFMNVFCSNIKLTLVKPANTDEKLPCSYAICTDIPEAGATISVIGT
jgi:hypothetical protein